MGWEDLCRALKQVRYQVSVNLEVMYMVRSAPKDLLPATYTYLYACAAYLAEKIEEA